MVNNITKSYQYWLPTLGLNAIKDNSFIELQKLNKINDRNIFNSY